MGYNLKLVLNLRFMRWLSLAQAAILSSESKFDRWDICVVLFGIWVRD